MLRRFLRRPALHAAAPLNGPAAAAPLPWSARAPATTTTTGDPTGKKAAPSARPSPLGFTPTGSATLQSHYTFGGKAKPYAKPVDKKDFRDLFEFKDTVGKDSTIEETQISWWRVFWAKPIDHKDDNELDFKKRFERTQTFRGHYRHLYESGEDSCARLAPPGSELAYMREHIGGLVWLQVWIQCAITAGAFGLLAFGAFDRAALHNWWNAHMPVGADFADPASSYKEPMTWPFHMSPAALDNFHTANAIGTWSMPLQFAVTWWLHPRVRRTVHSWKWVQRAKRAIDIVVADAKRAAARPKV